MHVKGRSVWILVGALALCAAPAGAATLRWNVPGGRPSDDYVLVTDIVKLELIAELGLDEPLVEGVFVRAEALPGIHIEFLRGEPNQVALSSTVDGSAVPWLVPSVAGTAEAVVASSSIRPTPDSSAPATESSAR